jgi:enoyl-CoA hydratase
LPRLIGLSRALDMILTGRPVGAEEALSWGLANRVVADGTSREAAEKLALEISKFPQTCMRGDRRSAYAQSGASIQEALEYEFEQGTRTVLSGETAEGALRFAGGAGRHGSFEG